MEIEIEHWERLYRLAQEYPTPFMSHALGYIRAKIDRLKEEKQ